MPTQQINTDQINGYSGGGGGSSPLTTKGDIYTRSASADARLAVGTDGQVLTADAASTAGVKWATSAGGGTDAKHRGAWTATPSEHIDFESNTIDSRFVLDNSGTGWTVVSDAATGTSYTKGLRSRNPGEPGTSQMTLTVTTGAGNMTLRREVSSESGFDTYQFYIDNVLQDTQSGGVGWTQTSYSVTAGSHVFKWTYHKDSSGAGGYDGWTITDINWPSTTGNNFVVGDVVTYGGFEYRCNTAMTSQVPGTGGDWTAVAGLGTGNMLYRSDWSAASIYALNDVVRRNSMLYIATAAHTANDYDPSGAVGNVGDVTGAGSTDGTPVRRSAQAFTVNAAITVTQIRAYVATALGATALAGIASDFNTSAMVPWLGKGLVPNTTGFQTVTLDNPVNLVPGVTYRYTVDASAGDLWQGYTAATLSGVIATAPTGFAYGTSYENFKTGVHTDFALFAVKPGTNWSLLDDNGAQALAAHAANTDPHPQYLTKAKAINAQTGTTYTLVLGDAGKFVTMTNASAFTLTVPPNSSVAFPVGTEIEGAQLGAGQVTFTPGAAVTINGTPGLKVAAQYGTFRLLKIATDTWLASGSLST